MEEKEKNYVTCKNKKCSHNKNNKCKIITENKMRYNRVSCEERIWWDENKENDRHDIRVKNENPKI